MNRPSFNTGGELLEEWNRLRAQFAGAALLGFSLYPLYSILNECFSR